MSREIKQIELPIWNTKLIHGIDSATARRGSLAFSTRSRECNFVRGRSER